MNKILKQNINFYIIYLIISLILISIPIICFIYFLLTADNGENPSSIHIPHILSNILNICFIVLLIFSFLYLYFRNFLLIWLWMFIKKFHPHSGLMQFFKTLQNDNSKQILVLILSLIFDILPILLIKNFFRIPLWPDSILDHLKTNSGGLITNFIIFILVLKIDGWIKNRKVAKKSIKLPKI